MRTNTLHVPEESKLLTGGLPVGLIPLPSANVFYLIIVQASRPVYCQPRPPLPARPQSPPTLLRKPWRLPVCIQLIFILYAINILLSDGLGCPWLFPTKHPTFYQLALHSPFTIPPSASSHSSTRPVPDHLQAPAIHLSDVASDHR